VKALIISLLFPIMLSLPDFLFQGNDDIVFNEEPVTLTTEKGSLSGTLLIPRLKKVKPPIVLIIAGSGPTDRDGNIPGMKNNSLRLLAEGLAKNGIASLRYDKRGIGGSLAAAIPEKDLTFTNFVNDAVAWMLMLNEDRRFSGLYVLGHSEGSLIGMLACQQQNVDGFISVAGAGKPADQLIREQLKSQPPQVRDEGNRILDSLAGGKYVNQVPGMLNSIFRPSVQPYLMSWFQYDPAKEIYKLSTRSLILQGTTDIQVSEEDAKSLASHAKRSELVFIEGMNHIMKNAGPARAENMATYNKPDLPVNEYLLTTLIQFISPD
jgi:pimeloyl-ACP methyl ester carboxylesterase